MAVEKQDTKAHAYLKKMETGEGSPDAETLRKLSEDVI